MGKPVLSLKEIPPTTHRHEGLGPSLRAAIGAWSAGIGIVLVLFAASIGYIVFRGEHDVRSVLNFIAGAEASTVDEPQRGDRGDLARSQ